MNKELKVNIDEALLKNGFEYFSDWEYGPQECWILPFDRITMKLMEMDRGYWIILDRSAGGSHERLNIGESSRAADIIALRDMLVKCSGVGQ